MLKTKIAHVQPGSISVSVSAKKAPTQRPNKAAYEQAMGLRLKEPPSSIDREGFSLTIYDLPLPKHVSTDLFPGLTSDRADALGLDEKQRLAEYIDFGQSVDSMTRDHLVTILKIWEEHMPHIAGGFWDSSDLIGVNGSSSRSSSLKFVIPDHLEWFDQSAQIITKTSSQILQESSTNEHARATVRLTVGINAEEGMNNPRYIWGPSQILLSGCM